MPFIPDPLDPKTAEENFKKRYAFEGAQGKNMPKGQGTPEHAAELAKEFEEMRKKDRQDWIDLGVGHWLKDEKLDDKKSSVKEAGFFNDHFRQATDVEDEHLNNYHKGVAQHHYEALKEFTKKGDQKGASLHGRANYLHTKALELGAKRGYAGGSLGARRKALHKANKASWKADEYTGAKTPEWMGRDTQTAPPTFEPFDADKE